MRVWTDERKSKAIQHKAEGMTYRDIAQMFTNLYGHKFTPKAVKNVVLRTKEMQERVKEDSGFNETVKKNKDGTVETNKLITMDEQQEKDDAFILHAHGYDPNKWELLESNSSKWHQHNKVDKTVTLYASKIKARPLKDVGYYRLIEAVKLTKPLDVQFSKKSNKEKHMLEIPYYDTHFGISDYEYYKEAQEETVTEISKRHWNEVLFVLGSDMFHNDDFRGRTSSGREIETVDMEIAWENARAFYEPLIQESIQHANNVKIIFLKGNHDESMSWAFVQMLKARFPKLTFDDSFIERKIHTFGNNFIGMTHGDKGRKDIHNIFPVEFPQEWANATSKEIHMGHYHVEDMKDRFGARVRTLATRNKTDKWHRDCGYVGARKEFMIFEYTETKLKAIHYV